MLLRPLPARLCASSARPQAQPFSPPCAQAALLGRPTRPLLAPRSAAARSPAARCPLLPALCCPPPPRRLCALRARGEGEERESRDGEGGANSFLPIVDTLANLLPGQLPQPLGRAAVVAVGGGAVFFVLKSLLSSAATLLALAAFSFFILSRRDAGRRESDGEEEDEGEEDPILTARRIMVRAARRGLTHLRTRLSSLSSPQDKYK